MVHILHVVMEAHMLASSLQDTATCYSRQGAKGKIIKGEVMSN